MGGDDFLVLLNNARCLIGNSSVGIRECAYLGVPVVNIGSRQNKRDRGDNVTDVGYDKQKIKQSILGLLDQPRPKSSSVYGGGDAGQQIADKLAVLPLQFHKTITY